MHWVVVSLASVCVFSPPPSLSSRLPRQFASGQRTGRISRKQKEVLPGETTENIIAACLQAQRALVIHCIEACSVPLVAARLSLGTAILSFCPLYRLEWTVRDNGSYSASWLSCFHRGCLHQPGGEAQLAYNVNYYCYAKQKIGICT